MNTVENSDVARCDREQLEIEDAGQRSGWLTALGWADWEAEKWFIRAEADDRRPAHGEASTGG
jgi:hypothetical protein